MRLYCNVLGYLTTSDHHMYNVRSLMYAKYNLLGFFYLVEWDLTPIRPLCRSPRFV
jgi:hypothetical protein